MRRRYDRQETAIAARPASPTGGTGRNWPASASGISETVTAVLWLQPTPTTHNRSPVGEEVTVTLEEHPSVCTFDCPDTCSLSVTVENERIVRVRGSRAAPFTDGVICNKVAQDMTGFVHGERRLLHPLRRTGPKGSGRFERISWDAALNEIHQRVGDVIRRWGAQAVMPLNYAGPHGFLAGDSMSMRFFHRLGASQLYRRSLCGGVRSEAWSGTYGAVPGCPPEFAEHAKLNVV
jgi:anaerobic selenocysteine-containing dehydrogenase